MATAALWKRRKFQSTLPRRERHAFRHSIIYYIQYFNPRSRGGSDLNDFLVALFSGVFQSTLPRRERRNTPQPVFSFTISIHAPAEGATANIHNFFGVISEQNVHICIFSYIISFLRRINNHINKEINEFSGANRLGIYGCFIFARIFMKFLITAPLYNFFIKKYRIGLSDV